MEVLALKARSGGYRGCLIDSGQYRFFILTRNGRLKRLKAYPTEDFIDHDHFLAMMLKYIKPATIFRPPVEIRALSLAELDRIYPETGA